MAISNEQLRNDYRKLKQTLARYPVITISKSTGQPPEYYEIEYNLQGFVRSPDGSITTDNLHTIAIKLPFGYPHFPPTAKPLNHIFHPDIDPSAIRISDHWQKNPDLSKLVIIIGKMICGDIYNIDTPFNQEAADWYKQQQGQLPLDALQVAEITPLKQELDRQDEETGNEEDFLTIALEKEDSSTLALEKEDSVHEQINLLRLQIKQKNLFAASGIMSDIPQSVQFDDRDNIAGIIAKSLQQSDKLFKQAEALENQSRYDEAVTIVEKLAQVAADTPGLDTLRNRIISSLSLIDDLDPMWSDEKTNQPSGDIEPSPPPKTIKQSLKGRKKKTIVPIKSIAAIIVLIIITGAGTITYIQDKAIISQGREDINNINHLIQTRQFFEVQAEAEATLRSLTEIKILQTDADDISTELNSIMESEKFILGLQGRMLYNGKHVSFEQVDQLRILDKMTTQALEFRKEGRITKALSEYKDALSYANKHGLVIQVREIKQTIHNLSFTEAMNMAKKAEQAKEWSDAADIYIRALELSRNISDPAEAAKISKLLTAVRFSQGMDQSKQKFTARQWQETIKNLEQTQQLIIYNPSAISPQEIKEMNQLLLSSKLHQILTHAREASETRDWQQANKYYNHSLNFIAKHQDNFGLDIRGSIVQIKRTMLMIEISRENELAGLADHKNDHNSTLKHYRNILGLIRSSQFKDQEQIIEISENIQKRHLNIQKKVDMEAKISWLMNNFQEIFRKHYPAFAGSILTNPRAEFIKSVGTKTVFNLSCSEGRLSRLKLQYAYDRRTGKWSLYTGQ